MSFASVLATSFPEHCTREDLLALMREDAVTESDALGFRAALKDGEVLVSYPMSTLVWERK